MAQRCKYVMMPRPAVHLTEICLKRPVFAWVLMLFTVLGGGIAATHLGMSTLPDMPGDRLSIFASHPGATPKQMEQEVVLPLEDAIASVEGIGHIKVTSYHGWAQIEVRTRGARPIDAVVLDVQQRVAAVRLPDGVQAPSVRKESADDFPIAFLGLETPAMDMATAEIINHRVKDAFRALEGVSSVRVWGAPQHQARVWLDLDKLWEHDVTALDVQRALKQQHVRYHGDGLSSGQGRQALHLVAEATTVAALCNLPLNNRADLGNALRLCDVAHVALQPDPSDGELRFNGIPSVSISISKQRGANAVAVMQRVRAQIDVINRSLGPGQEIHLLYDNTQDVKRAVRDLGIEIALAILATAWVCRLFLGSWQSMLSVILALPMSLLGACAVMRLLGHTFNIYSMMGLTIAVGLVVDDAIMVLESIERKFSEGLGPIDAAIAGTRSVRFAALAATLGVVCIFAPLLFMQGEAGSYFSQFGVALSAAVLISYVEAISLAPVRSASFLKHRRAHHAKPSQTWQRVEQRFCTGLKYLMARPKRVFGAGVLLTVCGLCALKALPRDAFNGSAGDVLYLPVEAPSHYSLAQTDTALRSLESKLQATEGVRSVMAAAYGERYATIYVLLQPSRAGSGDLQSQLFEVLAGEAPLRAGTANAGAMQVIMTGDHITQVREEAEKMRLALQKTGLFATVASNLSAGVPQIEIVPNREQLFDAGIDAQTLSDVMPVLFAQQKTAQIDHDDRRIHIVTQMASGGREDVSHLQRIPVRTQDGRLIPLGSLAAFHPSQADLERMRYDRQLAAIVSAMPAPGISLEQAKQAIETAKQNLPKAVTVHAEGLWLQTQHTQGAFALALALGLVSAWLVLAAQFNSFRVPWLVMLPIPLAASGAGLALFISKLPLGESAMIGLLLLFGLVKKNAIMLVDSAQKLEQTGVAPRKAAVGAAMQRLRPILMTTTATAVALLPAAFNFSSHAVGRRSMAVGILGGLLSATFLTLVIVPMCLAWRGAFSKSSRWTFYRKNLRPSGSSPGERPCL